MVIKTLKGFTLRNTSTGELTSFGFGTLATVSDDLGNQLISDGYAVEYKLIEPTGSTTVNANGTFDVTQYASVTVDVGTLTVTYDVNGGTGTVTAVDVIAGDSVTLDDGTGITPPTDTTFAGWATEATATEPDVTSPYTPTADVTLYAVYTAV